jgi:glycosyltransferase involved in cell wall biosynthesis
MKILRIIRTLDPASGGMAEGIRQLVPSLLQLGTKTSVISLDDPSSEWLQNQGFDCFGLGPVAGVYGYRRGLPAQIYDLAKDHDVVIIDGIWHHHSFATWRALKGRSIPYFVYPHGMLDPWFKQAYPLKHIKKWAYWPWADYRVIRDASGVLFTSEEERSLARKSFWLYQAKEEVVGYGTSAPPNKAMSDRNIMLDKYPELKDKRIILFLGRIHPKKGLDVLLDAFAAIVNEDPRLHLLIAGPDEVGLLASLQQRAESLHISKRVTWAGMVSGDLKWDAYRCAELFCLPSHQENFGVAIVEALSCSLPVAISKPVNISCKIRSANAGLVFEDNIIKLEQSLREWLLLADSHKALMAENAKQLFAEQFDITRSCNRLLSVLSNQPRQCN